MYLRVWFICTLKDYHLLYIIIKAKVNVIFYVKKGEAIQLYQACVEINSLNIDRELNGLFEAMSHFDVDTAAIITWDQKDTFKRGNQTIHAQPARQSMTETQ